MPTSEGLVNSVERLHLYLRALLLRVLGRLGIRAFLWRIYCRCFGPEGGIVSLDIGEYHGRFYVHSEWVLKDLKTFDGEQDLLALLISKMRDGDVVYDVGANMGLHAVFLSQAVGVRGTVVAFEPEPHYCERLSGNAALNGLHNIRILPVALGKRSQTSWLLATELGRAAPRVGESVPSGRPAPGAQKVRVADGDSLVQTERLPLPRLIKIDVEGHEHAVLEGLRRTLTDPTCQIVCCEVHPALLPEGSSPDQILNLLRSCGFTHFDILPRPPQHQVVAYKNAPTE